jgi:predicted Zn finger-like uncharacterized protein
MIVKCEQCQTRFKIPDEKVTEKGVKVRCTKCQSTFRVKKAPETTAPTAPPKAAESDPFALFGSAADPPSDEATRPYPSPLRPPLSPSFDAQKELPQAAFESPTRVGPLPPRPEGKREVASAPQSWSPPPPPQPAPSAATLPAMPALDFGAPMEAAPPQVPQADPFAPSAQDGGLLGDIPLMGPTGNDVDVDLDGSSGPTGLPPTDARDELFQMPPPPPPAAVVAMAPAPSLAPAGRVALAAAGKGDVGKPAGRPDDVGMAEQAKGQGAFRRVAGVVVNLAVAGALMVLFGAGATAYLTGGKLDRTAFSIDRVKTLFAAPKTMVARGVTNGLYQTRTGRPVLFVHGVVENRGAAAGKGKVRAEILEGEALVRAVEGYAGALATPEDLFGLNNAADVDALNAKSKSAAAALAPGAQSEFLLTFYEYPPDLASFRIKVTVAEEGAKETAAR